MSVNGTLVEPLNLRILSSTSVPFTLTTRDGASAKFNTYSNETDYSESCFSRLKYSTQIPETYKTTTFEKRLGKVKKTYR